MARYLSLTRLVKPALALLLLAALLTQTNGQEVPTSDPIDSVPSDGVGIAPVVSPLASEQPTEDLVALSRQVWLTWGQYVALGLLSALMLLFAAQLRERLGGGSFPAVRNNLLILAFAWTLAFSLIVVHFTCAPYPTHVYVDVLQAGFPVTGLLVVVFLQWDNLFSALVSGIRQQQVDMELGQQHPGRVEWSSSSDSEEDEPHHHRQAHREIPPPIAPPIPQVRFAQAQPQQQQPHQQYYCVTM